MNRSLPIIIAGLSMTLLLASVISMDTFSPPDSPSVHPTLSALHVDGARIIDANGHEVTLVGLNYGDHPVNVPALTGDPVVDASKIKGMGFNAVRLVTEWGALENSSSPSDISYNEGNLTLLSRRVDALTSQGLYVIIKLHADADKSYDYQNLLRFLGTSQYCNVKGDYISKMGDKFFLTNSTVKTSSFYHLTQLWLRISRMTANNPLVVGYDFFNEPTNCSTTPPSAIRAAWHSRIGELLRALRGQGDNRMAYIQEAPFFGYYGGGKVLYTPYSDPLSNTVSSIHWYRDEYAVPLRSWQACSGDLQTLTNYYSNVTGPSGSLCSNVPLWAYQAQENFTNQAFDIGEFGANWGNNPGDVDDQWINNSTLLFREQHLTGWFYWSSSSTGTWIPDLTGTFTLALSQGSLTLNPATGPIMVNMTLTLTTTHPFTNTTMTKLESNDTFTDSTIGPVIQFTPTITRPAPTGRSVNVTVSVLIGATTPSKTYKFVISGSTRSGLTDTTVLTVTVA